MHKIKLVNRTYVRYSVNMDIRFEFQLKNTKDCKIELQTGREFFYISGPLYREEILIIATLIYASKGDLSRPIGIKYPQLSKFKNYKVDVTLNQFHEICYDLAVRRCFTEDRIGGQSALWFHKYKKQGWWCIFQFEHMFVKNVNRYNYETLYRKLIECI